MTEHSGSEGSGELSMEDAPDASGQSQRGSWYRRRVVVVPLSALLGFALGAVVVPSVPEAAAVAEDGESSGVAAQRAEVEAERDEAIQSLAAAEEAAEENATEVQRVQGRLEHNQRRADRSEARVETLEERLESVGELEEELEEVYGELAEVRASQALEQSSNGNSGAMGPNVRAELDKPGPIDFGAMNDALDADNAAKADLIGLFWDLYDEEQRHTLCQIESFCEAFEDRCG